MSSFRFVGLRDGWTDCRRVTPRAPSKRMCANPDNLNPYKSPSASDVPGTRPRSAPHRNAWRSVANGSLVIAVACLVIGWAIGVLLANVGWWDRFPPAIEARLYASVGWVAAGLILAGFMACIVCAITGSWRHRLAAVLLALVYWPLLVRVVAAVVTRVERLF